MFRNNKTFWLTVAALTALVGVLATPARAADPRLVARVDEPFEVNGDIYAAGVLVVREVGDYSPVATLNEITVNGTTLGILLARERGNQASMRDELVFRRARNGHLVLVALSFKGEPARDLYAYGDRAGGGPWQAPVRSRQPVLVASTQ